MRLGYKSAGRGLGYRRKGGSVSPIFPVASVSSTPGPSGGETSGIDTSGASLILISASYLNGSTPVISDNQGNVYVELTSFQAGGGNARQGLFYCVNPNTDEDHQFEIAGSSIYASISVAAFGLGGAYDGVVVGDGSASDTEIQAGSLTPSQPNCLRIMGVQFYATSGVPTIDEGFVILSYSIDAVAVGAFCSAIAARIDTAAVAANPTFVGPGSADRIAGSQAAFRHA